VRNDLVTKDLVHFLKTLSLCLWEEEKYDESVAKIRHHEENVETIFQSSHADGRHLRNKDITGPIRACTNGRPNCTDPHRKDLALVNPRDRAEADTEEQRRKDNNERDTGGLRRMVSRIHSTPFCVDRSLYSERDGHPNRTENQRRFSADAIQEVKDEYYRRDGYESTVYPGYH